jgi:hypothetical protein
MEQKIVFLAFWCNIEAHNIDWSLNEICISFGSGFEVPPANAFPMGHVNFTGQ